ncbi:threonine-phosphate decarboxylase [Steroidobacter sp. S1-65]|uniref:threonine-phosphate decarboxylase n=1 Tax=Steroidobacter gossypii TaxID=2805490 RepID=A0ABS1X2U2_9GAMM|nr:threonine-phosphate decarboxylase CobD [Steroidobacter gossypii]MBM0107530.1 threonine-phosphate decarboxylase [Steroidobacter gossypii]
MNHGADIVAGRFAHHGGRLCVARSLFPNVPQPWIDLSTGINPAPYPAPRASVRERNRLPEPTELARLEAVAAAAFNVEDPTRVVATGGTESALRLLPYVLKMGAAVVAGPTYSSHSDAWSRAGVETRVVADEDLLRRAGAGRHILPDEDTMAGGASVDLPAATEDLAATGVAMTVVNPNNPDGRLLERQQLQALHDSLHAAGGVLIVDEAFADLEPQHSVAALAGANSAPSVIVLRSFGKFYGLAGVRLGFVIASPVIAQQLRRLLGDWPISVDALRAGLAAYADSAWAAKTRRRLSRAAQRLDKLLISGGMTIVGGTSLYRLARAPNARARFTQLISHGILARPFDHDSTLLRFGLPHGSDDWRRVADALKVQP